eukprot:Partr_v1_DN24824_c0_g1_i1_m29665
MGVCVCVCVFGFTLVNIDKQSHNTAVFRFAFPNPSDVAGLPIASCLVTKIEVDGTDEKTGAPKKVAIIRPYTPITEPHIRGHLDLLIKCYPGMRIFLAFPYSLSQYCCIAISQTAR